MTDGIEVLLRHSCAAPAVPLLRSCFEASLGLEYILESEIDYVRRSLSWLAGYAHDRLDMYSRLDPTSRKGSSIQRYLKADKTMGGTMGFLSSSRAQQAMIPLQSLLAKPHFQAIEAEYSGFKRRPAWYRLFNGPEGLDGLAKHLNRYGQYEILYRRWSSVTHAADLSRFIARGEKGKQAVWALRSPQGFRDVAFMSATFILHATRLMLKKFRPTEDSSQWYTREVQQPYKLLSEMEIDIKEIEL